MRPHVTGPAKRHEPSALVLAGGPVMHNKPPCIWISAYLTLAPVTQEDGFAFAAEILTIEARAAFAFCTGEASTAATE
jgi:hypothetical protein